MSLLILQGKVPAGVIMNPSTYELKCLFWKGKIIWRQIYTSVLPICTVWNSKIHVCFTTLWNHWFWYQRGEKGVCLFASPAAQVPMARWAHAPTWSSLTCFIEGREKCKGRMGVPQLRARWLTWFLSLAVHLPRRGNFLYPSSVT